MTARRVGAGPGRAWFGALMGGGSFKLAVLAAVAGLVGLACLYFWDPAEIAHFPKCPFFALTGYQCPGCGTLRGIHALLHLHLADALKHNLFMVASLPVVLLLLLWPKFRLSVASAYVILGATLAWWLIRNMV